MKLEIDTYTKIILTVIAIALLLNVASPFIERAVYPKPAHASDGPIEVRVTDFRSTWPPKIEISNWPVSYPQDR